MGTIIGAGSLANQSSLLQAGEDRMLGQLKSIQSGKGNDGKIEKGAMEFESMLLSTWLQQAEQSMATVPGSEDDEDAGCREQMISMGTQELAKSMAASGGIGIARMIAKAMHAATDRPLANASPTEAQKGTQLNTGNK